MVRIGPCPTAIAVAIGGGGSTIYDAGSGSGYVGYEELRAFRPYLSYQAIVGYVGQASEIIDLTDGITILSAAPGVNGSDTDGGSGFSGGGADCYSDCLSGDGGAEGGDGQSSDRYVGGTGSRFDVYSIPVKSFALRYVTLASPAWICRFVHSSHLPRRNYDQIKTGNMQSYSHSHK